MAGTLATWLTFGKPKREQKERRNHLVPILVLFASGVWFASSRLSMRGKAGQNGRLCSETVFQDEQVFSEMALR